MRVCRVEVFRCFFSLINTDFFFYKEGNEAGEPWLQRGGGAAGPARLDAAVSLVQPPKPGRDPNQEQGLVLEGKSSPKAGKLGNCALRNRRIN